MTAWPSDYRDAWTLRASVERRGVGLHSGADCRVRLEPYEQPGLHLAWHDGTAGESPQRLGPHQVADTRLCTALRVGQRRLATVEHLLAALAGTGLTHGLLRVEGEEIPLLDGSALPWVEAIAEAGLQRLEQPAPAPRVLEPITRHAGASFAVALPAPTLQLGAAIDFPQPAIGRQLYTLVLTPQRFVDDIAPARTFGFREQVEQLRAAGLIRGGALDNALVCDGDHWINPPLRYLDEPVRHKLLDLLGDLALVGLPQAHVFAYRGSHGVHTALAAAIADHNPTTSLDPAPCL